MILRIVWGRLASGRLSQVAAELAAGYAPAARQKPGLVRFHAAVRPDGHSHRLVVVTCWTSVEAALAAYDGDLDTPRTLDGSDHQTSFTEVAYFELDESLLRRPIANSAVLRLTVGRVAQGIDAPIQQELRSRLHELDDSMTEAYVGRRILGADVEVAFISLWAAVPTDRSLDEPIWPDISGRYDAFVVETFVPILSGPDDG